VYRLRYEVERAAWQSEDEIPPFYLYASVASMDTFLQLFAHHNLLSYSESGTV
jgi:hypothetical protein